ncbi:NlpC/P60 family protein [Pseudomonas nitroreducens]|uniref:NlpC/P60 family protein n=1 Tax=Pseudomonas nitroreducens TaxID=46680 RepID=A0A5R8ZUK8_PSENT|nr:C40 family peptidase [Pseudomonas nitroreducens]TLP69960.1 NlpC/P60 family protein [Pseudomonas nitroreducens]
MRPLCWFPLYLLCTLGATNALADDFDAPDWRRYEHASIDRTLTPAGLTARTGTAWQVTQLGRRYRSAVATSRNFPGPAYSRAETSRIIARAHELIGTPYRWGGQSEEDGFDCSGLLVYLYRSIANRKLPRTTHSMIAQRHNAVSRDALQPGDAVFFNHNGEGSTSHVGLYIGDDRFIHAPSTGKSIRIDSLDNSYWKRSYTTARRFSG